MDYYYYCIGTVDRLYNIKYDVRKEETRGGIQFKAKIKEERRACVITVVRCSVSLRRDLDRA